MHHVKLSLQAVHALKTGCQLCVKPRPIFPHSFLGKGVTVTLELRGCFKVSFRMRSVLHI